MTKNHSWIWIVVVIAVVVGVFAWNKRASTKQADKSADTTDVVVADQTHATATPAPTASGEAFMGYTPQDVAAATSVIMAEFARFGDGFEMHALDPMPERNTPEELAYINSLDKGSFVRALVMASSFHTPSRFAEITAWEPDEEYTWEWHLGQTADGQWILATYGY